VDQWLDAAGHLLNTTMRRAREIILGGKLLHTIQFAGLDELKAAGQPRGRHPRVVRLEGRLAFR
jgi:hypothetical protein